MHDGIWVGKKILIGFRPIEKLRKKQVEFFFLKNQKNEASNLCG
jgi:hypothetical protein